MSCASCKHYRKLAGECHVRAPQCMLLPGEKPGQLVRLSVWPPVKDSESCGEYAAEVLHAVEKTEAEAE